MIGGPEGGNELPPAPPPEAIPETKAEAIPEPAPEMTAPAAGPSDTMAETAGADADVLSEGVTADAPVDTAKVEDAASRKLTDEMADRLSDAGVDAPGETVATGNLSANPEYAAAEIAAARQHAEDRAAYLIEQADAAKAEAARDAQDHADEAAALEAEWQAEQEEEAAFRSKHDDGRGAGVFEDKPNRDGTTHVTYRYETVDKGVKPEGDVPGESKVNARLSWDEDAEGNRFNSHLTDQDAEDEKTGKRKKPIDF